MLGVMREGHIELAIGTDPFSFAFLDKKPFRIVTN